MEFKSQVSKEDFEILHFLGKGNFGKVYQVRKKCGQDKNQIYAMKITNKNRIVKNKKNIERAFAEKNILRSSEHPFIVKIIYSFQSETKLYLILEYLCGGDMQNLLRKEKILSETAARFYIAEIILAMEYLHSRGIIYRDLKPANILLDQYGHIKIVDFGLSKEDMSTGQITYSTCGTLTYAAPEVINKTGHNKEADWWSLGILIFKMLTGQHPFSDTFDDHILAQSIVKGVYRFPTNFPFRSAGKDLIQRLLVINPKQRLGSSGVDEIKKHKFFNKIRWDEVYERLLEPPYSPQVESMASVVEFTKDDSKKSTSNGLVPFSGVTESQNQLFNGFSFTSEMPQLDNKCDNEDDADVANNLYSEARLLPENNVTIRKKLSNGLKSVKSFFNNLS